MKTPPQQPPIRVLAAFPFLPHYRRDVLRELDSTDGFNLDFASGSAAPSNLMPLMEGADLRNHHSLRNIWGRNLLWQRGLLRLVANPQYDIVLFFASANYVSTWMAAIVARLLGKRVVFWTIGWHRPDRGPKRAIRLLFYRLSHRLLLYGNTAFHIGAAIGFARERMAIVYNSTSEPSDALIDPRTDTAELDRALKYEGSIIGAVVRLNNAKRLDEVIRTAAQLRDRGLNVAVLLVGDGPEREALRSLATSLGVPLYLPGPAYDRRTIARAYDALDLTVIPGHAGLTTIQSLSHGTPVLTNDQAHNQAPESEAVIPGVTGDVFPIEDSIATVDVIARWIERVRNDANTVSSACKNEVAARWTSAAHAKRITAALRLEASY